MRRRLGVVWLACLMLAWPSSALAGRIPIGSAMRALRVASTAVRAYGYATGGTYVLNRQELAVCLGQQSRLQAGEASLEAQAKSITASEARLTARMRRLEQAADALDLYDGDAVERHNANVRALQTDAAAHDAKVTSYNAASERFNVEVERFNGSCAGRSYYVDDLPSGASP